MERKQFASKEHNHEIDIIPAFLDPKHMKQHQQHENIYPSPISDKSSIFDDEQVSEMVIRERLHYALDLQYIDLFMQPVVTLPQRHAAFYELFGRLRIKPGQYITAKDYMTLANEEHLVSNLDSVFLTQCLKVLKKQQGRADRLISYFINIKPFTLRNQDFMGNLVAILSKHKEIAHVLIFEMHYNDFLMLSPAEKKILGELYNIGCRFSIDHVKKIPINIEELAMQNISFIKIDAKTIMEKGKTEQGFKDFLNQKKRLNTHNINIIIEKIESESDLVELLDYDIKYGQGFLFGRPDFSGVYT